MTEMNRGWHQVGCSKCMDQWRRMTCHQMKSACAVCGASHWQLISFLDGGQCLDDRTLPLWPALYKYHCHTNLLTVIACSITARVSNTRHTVTNSPTMLPAQHVRPSGIFCCWPDCPELIVRRPSGSGAFCWQLQTVAEDIFIFAVLLCSVL